METALDVEDGKTDRREQRRRAMIEAARKLFLERGFDAVNVSDVVRRSGGSLSTLYDLFENKQGLLAAVALEHHSTGTERIDAIIAQGEDPPATLAAIAQAIHEECMHPGKVGMMRVVMAESLRSPDFAQRLFETLHVPLVERLARLFAGWAEAGLADISDARLAANLFLGLLLYGHQMRAFVGERHDPDPALYEAAIRDSVRLFAAGYNVRARPA
ncbi:TetR/AcrR family transcriptional regulator [Sphingomonas oleivorans]|uniref:TetR/AcrR family transcriptional regulator n=1 Tax=Sphingomonas oleivorans TaxID=1735121 RepID=UPI0013FD76AE|nr:TetR/AcrR family transcriptional regulator [Sphingomonas oleivorans]